MTTRTLINIAAIIELLAGLAMLVMPEYVIELLLGGGLNETGIIVTRVLGIGLFSLGVSVWALPQQKSHQPSLLGICTYNLGIAGLLLVLAVMGNVGGVLLWPAIVLHGLIGIAVLGLILPFGRT